MSKMKMRDRMTLGSPILKALIDRMDKLIEGHNRLVAIVFGGMNPHQADDVTNVVTVTVAVDELDEVIDLEQDVIDQYEAHLADTGPHLAADTTNVVTELGVAQEVYTLLNEAKVDYEANRINPTLHHGTGKPVLIYALLDELKVDYTAHKALVDSVHAGADSGNAITAEDATTKALAVALANDLKAQFIANYANISTHHTAADTVNPPTFTDLTGASTWVEIAAAADELRASYVAHIAASTVWHGAADGTNTVTASAIGSIEALVDLVNTVTAVPDADTKAKAVTLANALKTKLNAHMAVVLNVHSAADETNPVVVDDLVPATATWTLIVEMADAIRVAYEAHRALAGGVHDGADSTNTIDATAIGTIATAVYAGLNELKADFNAHIAESGTSHQVMDESMKIIAAAASTLATSITLINALKTAYADHISRADDVSAYPVVPTLDEE